MSAKIKILKVLLVWLFFGPVFTGYAQTNSLQINDLLVEIWPEYDRPEALVIYRIELSATAALPAQVTFELPGYIDSMHAVAYEQGGALLAVDPASVQLQAQNNSTLLTFTAPANNLQLEYYDPMILTKQGQNRQLNFSFTAPYDIVSTRFQVQQPLEAENFSVTPAATDSFTNNDGLTYSVINAGSLSAGDVFSLAATYSRSTDATSVSLLDATSEHAQDITVATTDPPAAQGDDNLLGYILVGAGIGLLLAVGGYWFYTSRQNQPTQPRRPKKSSRPARRKKQRAAAPDPSKQAAPPVAGFCYKCGVPLRADANFCHNCGAKRRETG